MSTSKDCAEFFRLALVCGLCTPTEVVAWADAIMETESTPAPVFFELSLCAHASPSSVQSLLHDVPGAPTVGLASRMLVAYAGRLVREGAVSPHFVLLRLQALSRLEPLPEEIASEISVIEDAYSLAIDGVYGEVGDVDQRMVDFLSRFRAYAPPIRSI